MLKLTPEERAQKASYLIERFAMGRTDIENVVRQAICEAEEQTRAEERETCLLSLQGYRSVFNSTEPWDQGFQAAIAEVLCKLRESDCAEMRELQPCGHPVACIQGSDEGTHWCSACGDNGEP